MGYLNRFSWYPLSYAIKNPQYISTIGNINWYCGYLVIILFAVIYYWWQAKELNKFISIFLNIYLFIGFGTLITQGSNSGIFVLLILFPVFYLLSMKEKETFLKFCHMLLIFSSSCIFSMLIRIIFPERMTYGDGITDLLTYSAIPYILFLISSLFYYLFTYKKLEYKANIYTIIGKIGIGVGFVALVTYVIIVLFGIFPTISWLNFSPEWGSNRGATWMAGIKCFMDQSIVGKLFGVGPDCMGMYIYTGTNQELLSFVETTFAPPARLTNAHNEWLTILVNQGLFGLVSFITVIVSAIYIFIKAGREQPIMGAFGMGILAYTINNMFSFQQPMNIIVFYLFLGMGAAYLRDKKKESANESPDHGTTSRNDRRRTRNFNRKK